MRENPCREIRLASGPKRKGPMNAERYWKMHDALPTRGQCFLRLMYFTRQRPTEIRLLKESGILHDRIIFQPTKTLATSGLEVEVMRTPEIDAVLDQARKLQKVRALRDQDDRFVGGDVFVIQCEDGGGYTRWGIRSMWDDAREKAGVASVTTRHVRPFALKAMEDMGVDLREIQKSAVHASVTTTEGYLDQHRDRVVDVRLKEPERPKP